MACKNCKEEITSETKGLEIKNYCLDGMPESIELCKECTENYAVKLLSGNIMGVLTALKGLMK